MQVLAVGKRVIERRFQSLRHTNWATLIDASCDVSNKDNNIVVAVVVDKESELGQWGSSSLKNKFKELRKN